MHNYNKDYKKRENPVVEEPVADEVIEELVIDDAAAEEVVEEIAEPEETIENTTKTGVVAGCKALKIRKTPNAINSANVICIIKESVKVIVDLDKSTDDWYSVCLENGVEGFCMKKFINLES